ncbi:MAG: BON domain-containing protein, partial [Actinobacteria bacterium]|nr:BON domain-containing protein [Actinomycetota bacterium]
MGLLRRSFRHVMPFSRLGAVLWAWRHRQQIAGWAGWMTRAVPRIAAGDTRDVVTEGRLQAALSTDRRLRDSDQVRAEVVDGVAVLHGVVSPEAHDAAINLATTSNGVRRVRDELQETKGRR